MDENGNEIIDRSYLEQIFKITYISDVNELYNEQDILTEIYGRDGQRMRTEDILTAIQKNQKVTAFMKCILQS